MTIKPLEIRDRGTRIGVLAIKMDWLMEKYTVRRYLKMYGYPETGRDSVIVMKLNNQEAQVDPYAWGGRTMPTAHKYITDNFDDLEDGDVVDVEFILGETDRPKESEILTSPYV